MVTHFLPSLSNDGHRLVLGAEGLGGSSCVLQAGFPGRWAGLEAGRASHQARGPSMPPPEGFSWGLSARSTVCSLGSQGHFRGAGAWSLRSPSWGRAWDVRGICGRGPSHNGGLASRKGVTETLQGGVRPGEWGSRQESPASGLQGPAGRGVASVREGVGGLPGHWSQGGSPVSSRVGRGGQAWPLVRVGVCSRPSPQSPECASPWGAHGGLDPVAQPTVPRTSTPPWTLAWPSWRWDSAGGVSPTPRGASWGHLGQYSACLNVQRLLPCKLGLRPKAPGSPEASKPDRQTTEELDSQFVREMQFCSSNQTREHKYSMMVILDSSQRGCHLDSPWHTVGAQQRE